MSPDCDRKIQVMIMWADHSIESGHSATEAKVILLYELDESEWA